MACSATAWRRGARFPRGRAIEQNDFARASGHRGPDTRGIAVVCADRTRAQYVNIMAGKPRSVKKKWKKNREDTDLVYYAVYYYTHVNVPRGKKYRRPNGYRLSGTNFRW